jgi:hypothetical protein
LLYYQSITAIAQKHEATLKEKEMEMKVLRGELESAAAHVDQLLLEKDILMKQMIELVATKELVEAGVKKVIEENAALVAAMGDLAQQ